MAQNESYKIQVVIEGQDRASQSLSGVNRELDKMDGSVNQTRSSWEKFDMNAFIGATAVVAGLGAIVGKLNEVGTAANAAERTFNQVSGGVDKAAESLARMRSLTGGVIDDMTLMKGASSLLVTGIADTNEQAEELVNLGSRLSAVMGVDAAEGIANLNSALLNNSFLRLDTLGISAAAVRERVNELKDAGYDMSEAFSAAVLEIGNETLLGLGDAANVAETSVAKLSTRFGNMAQDLGQWVNVELEKMATTIEQIIVLADTFTGNDAAARFFGMEETQYDALIATAEEYQRRRDEIFSAEGYSIQESGLSAQEVLTFNQDQTNASMFPDISSGSYFQDAFESLDPTRINDARMAISLLRPEWAALTDEQLEMYALDIDNTFRAVADAQEAYTKQTVAATAAAEEQVIVTQAQAQALSDFNSLEARGSQLGKINEANAALEALVETGQIQAGANNFFNPATLAEVQSNAEAVVAEYERIKELGENSEYSLVSELEVERAKEIAEAANETAEQAERNAIAWEKASLAMIAGATGGGRENEFYQMVLAGIEDPEQRAALEQQFNLQSGTETVNTMVTEYAAALNTALVEEFGTGRGAQMGEEIYLALEEGIAAGLEGEELKTYIEERVGYALSGVGTGGGTGTGGEEITVQAGEGYIALAQRTGYTREELEAANGGGMLLAGQVIVMPDGTNLIAIGEDATPEDLTKTATDNILNGALRTMGQDPMVGNDASVPFIYSDQYQGYIGDTGSHAGQTLATDNTTGEVVYITSEQGEIIGEATDDIAAMDTSMQTIAETDTSAALDPMLSDMDELQTGLSEFETSMTRLSTTQFSLEVPISFVFDMQTAEMLSRNSQVVELVRLILPQLGVTPS